MSLAIDDRGAPEFQRPPAHPPHATANPLLLAALRAGKLDENGLRKLPRRVREYQEAQNALIDDLLDIEDAPSNPWDAAPEQDGSARARFATRASFGINVVLCLIKYVAFIYSQSYVVLASAVDSTMDLVSGGVLFCQARAAAGQDRPKVRDKYPTGLSRLEPVSVLIFAVLMAALSLQIFYESTEALIAGLTKSPKRPTAGPLVIAIIVTVILTKFGLHVWCQRVASKGGADTGPVQALADDHRNDVISNTWGLAALMAAAMGPGACWVADPVGAMTISVALVYCWACTAKEQGTILVGAAPDTAFIARLAYLALKASPELVGIDTLRVYSAGAETYTVEIDLILPPEMLHRDAHDIGQALQDRLEADAAVARAFVHLDWEASHVGEHLGKPSLARPRGLSYDAEAPLLVKKGT